MTQNIIIKGRDNPVVMSFTFRGDFSTLGLANFNEIFLKVGTETYSTVTTPNQLYLNGNFELRLKIGVETSLAAGTQQTPEIWGVNATYDDGYLLSGAQKVVIPSIIVA